MKLSEAITEFGDIDLHQVTTMHGVVESIIVKDPETHPCKQKIDLSRLIESELDCEFRVMGDKEFQNSTIGKLIGVGIEALYPFQIEADTRSLYTLCRPRMNHIHACPNGYEKSPLPDGFKVVITFQDKSHSTVHTTDNQLDNHWRNARYIEILGVSEGWEL